MSSRAVAWSCCPRTERLVPDERDSIRRRRVPTSPRRPCSGRSSATAWTWRGPSRPPRRHGREQGAAGPARGPAAVVAARAELRRHGSAGARRTREVVDVGSGAGLPGLVLALARPDVAVTLVEPLLRRVSWLEEVVADLGLDAVSGGAGARRGAARLGLRRGHCPRRGAARHAWRWCLPLLREGGVLLALKGRSAADELAHAEPALRRLGAVSWAVREVGGEPSRRADDGGRGPQGKRSDDAFQEQDGARRWRQAVAFLSAQGSLPLDPGLRPGAIPRPRGRDSRETPVPGTDVHDSADGLTPSERTPVGHVPG